MAQIKIILITILIIFLVSRQNLKSQTVDYKYVDSLTYSYYLLGEWQNLETAGIMASKQKHDSYYLNIRTALAAFNLGNYITAEKYFKKAIKNDDNDFAKEYLFWTYYNLGDNFSANDIFKKLPETAKFKSGYNNSKFLDFAYIEAGRKFSNQPDSIIGNVNYFNFGMNHYLTPNIKMYEAYTFLSQNQNWGNYTQNEGYINLTFNLHHKLNLDLATHFASYKSDINFKQNINQYITNTLYTDSGIYTLDTTKTGYSLTKGSFNQTFLVAYIGLNKTIGRFKISASFNASFENNLPNINYTYTENQLIYLSTGDYPISYYNINLNNNSIDNLPYPNLNLQGGLKISYFPKILKDGLETGIKLYGIMNQTGKYFTPVPYVNLNYKNKYFLNSDFMQKGSYPLSDNAASTLLNNYNDLKMRYSFTAGYKLNEDASIYTTYLFENIYDNITLKEYKLNSLILGIKLNF